LKVKVKKLGTAPLVFRLTAFLLILGLVWLPFVAVGYAFLSDANTRSIAIMAALFIEFFLWLWIWGRWIYERSRPLQHYGLQINHHNGRELLQGLSIGLCSLLGLFLVQDGLGWLTWQPLTWKVVQFGLEGLVISLAVGLGEELIFRGWLLDELQQDCHPTVTLWADSLAFAGLHFIRPISEIVRTSPQFLGLVLLGLTLVWAKRRSGDRLGLSIGLHAGLVWGFYMINVGQMIEYTRRVPDWLTGIDNNPLAGMMGLLFLGAIAVWSRWRSR
jgi:membrane protease YdiL (CAAX protease family)